MLAISIQNIERRLRGGTQALLVRDRSGAAYVAKFAGNPQGTRTLVNEWIASRLLKHLRVSTPEVCALELKRGIPGEEMLEFQMGQRRIPIAEGVHLGSRCPVDPERKAIFDFLPRTLLDKVTNLSDLLAALVFDRWVSQCDSRQAIFIRESSAGGKPLLRTYLVDHGQSFGGSHWQFSDTPLASLYYDRSIYAEPQLAAIAHSNVDKIQRLNEEIFVSIEQDLPQEWLNANDHEEMNRLFETLAKRRLTLHDSIDRTLREIQQAGYAIPKNARSAYVLIVFLRLVFAWVSHTQAAL
jgi:hypothetical protein